MSPELRPQERRFLFYALGGSFVLLLVELLMPLGGDNEIYQSMATELVHYHWLPYISSWDQNFPGIIYLHALSIVSFGDSAFAFRSFDVVAHLLLAAVGYRLLRRWLSPRLAMLSVLLYNFHYIAGGLAYAGEREEFIVVLLIIILEILYSQREKAFTPSGRTASLLILAGILFAEIVAIRPSYGLVLFTFGYIVWDSQHREKAFFLFSIGAVVFVLAVIIPYLTVHGGLEQLYLSTIQYNLDVWGSMRVPLSRFWGNLRGQKFFLIPALISLAYIAIPSLRARIKTQWKGGTTLNRQDRIVVASLVGIALFNILLMGKYWPYHFAVFMFFVVPFSAAGFQILYSVIARRSVRIAITVAFAAYAYVRVFPRYIVEPALAAAMHGIKNPIELAADRYTEEGFKPRTDASVAAYLELNTNDTDRIECDSKQAGVRWRTQRRSASPFTTIYPLVLTTRTHTFTDYQIRWREEYIDSLLSARPRFVVLSTFPVNTDTVVNAGPPASVLHAVPGFDSLIMPHYRYDTTIGGYIIFRRKD